MLQKLFPSCVGVPPASSFKLIFVAQGFPDRTTFMSACSDFYEWLLTTPPFNVTRYSPEWLTVFAHVPASSPAIATAPTVAGGAITVYPAVLGTLVDSLAVREHDAALPLSDLFLTDVPYQGPAGGLLVVLLPRAFAAAAQIEHAPGTGEYHFIALTTDDHWQQLVARTIANLLGLAEEHSGTAQAPTTALEKAPYAFNTDYLPDQAAIAAATKWRVLGTNSATPTPPAGSPDTYPTTPDDVAFWQGAGGFQTTVYRTAKDCLMRRRLADPSSSLRARRVPLCLACRTALLWRIAAQ